MVDVRCFVAIGKPAGEQLRVALQGGKGCTQLMRGQRQELIARGESGLCRHQCLLGDPRLLSKRGRRADRAVRERNRRDQQQERPGMHRRREGGQDSGEAERHLSQDQLSRRQVRP